MIESFRQNLFFQIKTLQNQHESLNKWSEGVFYSMCSTRFVLFLTTNPYIKLKKKNGLNQFLELSVL